MEKEKLNANQLSEASGGDGTDYTPIVKQPCRECGKMEDQMYLRFHGGLCRDCVGGWGTIPACPVCGGMMRLISAKLFDPTGHIQVRCINCGHTMDAPSDGIVSVE